MTNGKFICEYICRSKEYTLEGEKSEFLDAECSVTDGAIKVKLLPKTYIKLKKAYFVFEHEFVSGDKFFANGYQSWSTSREYSTSERQKGITPIAKALGLERLAGISADVWFCEEQKRSGVFNSHCYAYIKNNESYFLIGSLGENTGFTVITADFARSTITVAKDVEGVCLSEERDLMDVVMLSGSESEVFDRYFDAMGVMMKNPKVDRLTGYTSWYNYFQKINESIILRDLEATEKVREHINIFQIDDGYETFVGDWLDPNPEKFPNGMKFIADKIHKKGYMAGIWLAPFNVQIKSRTYREHPDWVIRDEKGKPLLGCAGWGGAYTLDIYNEEVREYIKHFFDVILGEWGYDMVKLDFLYSQCQLPRNNKSRGEIMCDAMDFLRECCADKLILGCGVPLGAAFGRVDACRISCDVDLVYSGKYYNRLELNNEIPSAQLAMNNSIFRRQLNGRVFLSDPDVFFLRYKNLKFNMDQKILLGFINHLCGSVLFVSDDMNEYYEDDFEKLIKIYGKSQWRVLDANLIDDSKKMVLKLLDENGNVRMLWYDVAKGFGNQTRISGMFAKR